MQFHLNGFHPGDPEDRTGAGAPTGPLPPSVDVLIVGCGPAGLTLAAQLSVFAGISTAIVERKSGPLKLGQADGIACRTIEMFNAMGFADRVLREAYWVNETSFWTPDGPGGAITRTGRIDDTPPGMSEFPHVILNQARVHDFLLDKMECGPAPIAPHYGWQVSDLSAAESGDHPVTVTLTRADDPDEIAQVRARYVVGCDGARSTVRGALGLALKGEAANQAWGVMDVLAVTDFPDIRLKTLVRSADQGTLLIIPREGGYLVRLYIEMDKLNSDERVAARQITVNDLIAAAGRILAPHSFAVHEVAWWSVYEIGQRMCDRFDDVPAEARATRSPRVFIAGDACHTHSPKAGQGMNVSMRDAFNLGWKLAAVLEGRSPPALLTTYSDERHAVARDLITFDREWAAIMSAGRTGAADPAQIQAYFERSLGYTAGTTIQYAPSVLTGAGAGAAQDLASGFPMGQRFHSAPAIRVGDGKRMELGHVVQADGRWRLFAFDDGGGGVATLCRHLDQDPTLPLRRATPPGADVDAILDLRAIFQTDHRDLELSTLPPLLLPAKGRYGLTDYEKVFCPCPADGAGAGPDIFATRGIDRMRGALLVVRPDQHVGCVLALSDLDGLRDYFAPLLTCADNP